MKFICRLPFAENLIFASTKGQGKKNIELSSFTGERKLEIKNVSLIYFEEKNLEDYLSNEINFPEFKNPGNFPNHESYLEEIKQAIEIIKENNLPKLVISRPIEKDIQNLDLPATFKNICNKYKNALCYLLISDQEIWMGATPEILGKFNKKTHDFFTMSLAGTLPLDEEWTIKEIEEQRPVSQYISEKLNGLSTDVKVSETYSHISGNIKHLRNDFTAKIEPENLELLISRLHPTPAVCGIPKDFCKEKILEIEKYNREFYAGYIKIETAEEIFYFVNLRCSKIYNNKIVAFAGGGITSKSNPEKEWQETELKSQAILNHLIY